jgi:hypothetical protein
MVAVIPSTLPNLLAEPIASRVGMSRLRVALSGAVLAAAMVPALAPHRGANQDDHRLHVALIDAGRHASVIPVDQATLDRDIAVGQSLFPYLRPTATDADKARADASFAAFQAYTAGPPAYDTRLAYAAAYRRQFILAARKLVLSSALLVLGAIALIVGVSRLQRGRQRSGAVLLLASAVIVPLAIPFSLGTASSMPVLSMFASQPKTMPPLSASEAPLGAVWTPDAIEPMTVLVAAQHVSPEAYFSPSLEASGGHAAARERLRWVAFAACLAMAASLMVRPGRRLNRPLNRPQPDLV